MSEDDRKLFVGGTKNADDATLRNYFQKFGEIESVKVIFDRETDRYTGEHSNRHQPNSYARRLVS